MKVLITGAGSGIGYAIAKKLHKKFDLIVHASKKENLDKTWTLIEGSGEHERLIADLSNPKEVNLFCKQLKQKYNDSLHAVVNNAGVSLDKSIIYQPEKEIDHMLNINLKAPIMICKAAMKIFTRKQTGIIINISSTVAETGNAFQAVYSATKSAIITFSKSLAREVAELNKNHNIRVLSVSPGIIDTEILKSIPEEILNKYIELTPSRRLGKAEEVAETIAFLLSDKAEFINGTDLKINGGII